MKIACIQCRSGVNIQDNLDQIAPLIKIAVRRGAQLIATPEMTHILQRSPKRLFESIYLEEQDPGILFFSKLAQTHNIHLLIGSLAIKAQRDKAANRSFLFNPNGDIQARYDKIHMFDVSLSASETWMESRVYQAGQQPVTSDVGEAKLGLSICYDVRFPELYRAYAQAGADIISVPAAFTYPTGKAHWKTLLRARAIESGAYIIAPAQGGLHEDGRTTWGHSMIIDPWGHIIAALDHDQPDVLLAEIDLDKVQKARHKIPAWNIRKDYKCDLL